MCQPVGVVRIGLVDGHIERRLGMARVDADGRQLFRLECVVNQTDKGPVSKMTSSGRCACLRIVRAIVSESEAHLPRQIRLPSRRTDIDVSFMETPNPIYSPMAVLLQMLGRGFRREPVLPSYRGTATPFHV